MTHNTFTTKYNGRFLEFNGDQYRNQCMDEFWAYLKEVLNVDPTPYRGWGTAKRCYLNFNNIKGASANFIRIPNTPTGVPQKGDIIFWGTYPFVTGFAGHVAIIENANVNTLISFDQNWPTYSPCHFQKHSYKGVMGWLRKR